MKNKELSKIDTKSTTSPHNYLAKATDTTPFLSPHDRDGYVHQILSPVPSPNRPIIPSFSMSSSSPHRSIYLGIDVGTGSARAGHFSPKSIFSYSSRSTKNSFSSRTRDLNFLFVYIVSSSTYFLFVYIVSRSTKNSFSLRTPVLQFIFV